MSLKFWERWTNECNDDANRNGPTPMASFIGKEEVKLLSEAEYFHTRMVAVTDALLAREELPSPESIVLFSARIAELELEEIRKRYPMAPLFTSGGGGGE